ncbi:hypothetical protein KPH14_005469 [Odynerus spinipes]|uniref:Uncharacterized protein n=1 Tax=Odynerus spinipes TaxID=1348599 RepID=A0AAD9RBX5_9HYME|nr:hypothetical protein KPH14_005469 [Odynerus spinipes]
MKKTLHTQEPAATAKVPPPVPPLLSGLQAPPKSVPRRRDYDLSIPRNKCRMQLSHCPEAFVGFESSPLRCWYQHLREESSPIEESWFSVRDQQAGKPDYKSLERGGLSKRTNAAQV